jgi:hypothetical protein
MKPKYENSLSMPKREGEAHFPQSHEATKLQFQLPSYVQEDQTPTRRSPNLEDQTSGRRPIQSAPVRRLQAPAAGPPGDQDHGCRLAADRRLGDRLAAPARLPICHRPIPDRIAVAAGRPSAIA